MAGPRRASSCWLQPFGTSSWALSAYCSTGASRRSERCSGSWFGPHLRYLRDQRMALAGCVASRCRCCVFHSFPAPGSGSCSRDWGCAHRHRGCPCPMAARDILACIERRRSGRACVDRDRGNRVGAGDLGSALQLQHEPPGLGTFSRLRRPLYLPSERPPLRLFVQLEATRGRNGGTLVARHL